MASKKVKGKYKLIQLSVCVQYIKLTFLYKLNKIWFSMFNCQAKEINNDVFKLGLNVLRILFIFLYSIFQNLDIVARILLFLSFLN